MYSYMHVIHMFDDRVSLLRRRLTTMVDISLADLVPDGMRLNLVVYHDLIYHHHDLLVGLSLIMVRDK